MLGEKGVYEATFFSRSTPPCRKLTDRRFACQGHKILCTRFCVAEPRSLLTQAIEAEVAEWIEQHQHVTDQQGRRQVVRNGYLPARKLVTGVGEVAIEQPRVHDRRPEGEREQFSSKLLPPYLRKTKSIEELIP